jgi:signal transduction histidine kinase
VGRLIGEACDTLGLAARHKGIQLTAAIGADSLTAYADPARAKQILTNLIDNAVKVPLRRAAPCRCRPGGRTRRSRVSACR